MKYTKSQLKAVDYIKDILFANSDDDVNECYWIPVEGTRRFQLVLDVKTLNGILDLINEDD
jgi:hypothetical protein